MKEELMKIIGFGKTGDSKEQAAEEANMLPLAVLIDADNISPASMEGIFSSVRSLGEPIVRRAYGMVSCFASNDGWPRVLRENGIVACPQVSNIMHKNVADIALVIDAMALLYKGPVKGFCIVSSDSDFTGLAAKIREEGKLVYGFGDGRAPESFRSACSKFFEINVAKQPVAAKVNVPKQVAVTKSNPKQVKKETICPRCGGELSETKTKSNQDCRMCKACGGMTIKLNSLKTVFAEDGLKALLEKAKLHEQAGCICPDCGSSMSLLKVSTGKRHIEIDVCGNCQALWYDKDEFEALVPTDGMLQPTVSAGKAYRRDMTLALTADLRNGKLKVTECWQLERAMKNNYHVPTPDISPIIGSLKAQQVIKVESKTGKLEICKAASEMKWSLKK